MTSFVERRSAESLQRRALENVARLVEYHRASVAALAADAPPVSGVGIIGAGAMGEFLAGLEIGHAVPTTITDGDRRVLCRVAARVAAEIAREVPVETAQESTERLLTVSISLGPVLRNDLVIESITESLAAKQKLYAEIESQLPPQAVLATNTGTISIGRLASVLRQPERFCGIHFCHPMRQRPLVEVVRGPRTSPQTLAMVVRHLAAVQRMPVVVSDGPGFLVNRLLLPYLCAAVDLLALGVSPSAVEDAAAGFGMALGPLRLLDEIGLDRMLQYGAEVSPMLGPDEPVYRILAEMVKHGRVGRSVGMGFYDYPDDPSAPPTPSRNAAEIIAAQADGPAALNDHALTMSLILPVLLTAAQMIEERQTANPRDIDLGAIYGLGFPPTAGGLLYWADNFGPARILEMLRPLPRFVVRVPPPPLLHRLARSGGRFYS